MPFLIAVQKNNASRVKFIYEDAIAAAPRATIQLTKAHPELAGSANYQSLVSPTNQYF
jgi:2-oxo-4-hydroxy-4-carboxy--5-ureidoimidazoline (OHCU) decarboxylase